MSKQSVNAGGLGVLALVCVLIATNVSAQSLVRLAPGFLLDRAGSVTSMSGEIIAGRQSIKGSNSGTGTYNTYLRTDPNTILLVPGRRYQITFRYTILETPDQGFEVLFYSTSAAAAGSFLPGRVLSGSAGSTGVATVTNTLGNYTDYHARWNVIGKGTIVIDDIRITEETGQTVAYEDAEGLTPRIRLAQAFLPPASVARTFAVALAVTGGTAPYTWTAGRVALPGGLALAADGYLFGKPSTAGTYTFDARVTDASGASVLVPLRMTVASAAPLPAAESLTIAGGVATVRPKEYLPAFRNPLAGMRSTPQTASEHVFSTLAHVIVEWNLLERSESDTVQRIRDVTDQLLDEFARYNVKAIPRVYLVWPEPRATYWPSDLATDDYTSDAFRSRMKRLITRLGEVWNSDPRIGYIDTGIIGYWGEQHHPYFASSGFTPALPPEMEQIFGDAYRDAFPDKLLMHRDPRNFVGYEFGIHWDVFGAFDRGVYANDSSGMTLELTSRNQLNKWKVAPRGGEVSPTFMEEPDWSEQSRKNVVKKYASRLLELIRNLHWNHLNVLPPIDASDPDLWQKATEIQNALGYRFVIDEASYSAAVGADRTFPLTVNIRNTGSSPFYYAWPIEVALLDAQTRRPVWRTTWDGLDIRTWLPGETVTLSKTFIVPNEVAPNQYVLSLAILDPAGMLPSARFANMNYWAGGRTPIGPVSVGVSAPTVEVNEFDDLQTDRSLYYVPGSRP